MFVIIAILHTMETYRFYYIILNMIGKQVQGVEISLDNNFPPRESDAIYVGEPQQFWDECKNRIVSVHPP